MTNNNISICKLCGGEASDLGHGMSCRKCGLWLGDNSVHANMGTTYKDLWNGKYIEKTNKKDVKNGSKKES